MAKVIVSMTISLDGFLNDRNGSVERLFFVVTREPPRAVAKGENAKLPFEFVGDVGTAVQQNGHQVPRPQVESVRGCRNISRRATTAPP